ncbi:MAG: fused MFS/spermidine synthase [Polyangia bacterium]
MGLIVFLCFFLSGGSGLLFEVLWTRELGLVFGSTTLAMSTVLSVFMGGLALGSYLGGHLARRFTSPRGPLRAYALVEAGVGAYALVVPLILSRYPALNAVLWRTVGDHYGVLSLLRFLATALLLLLPTTLMGATLPLLSQYVSLRRRLVDQTRAGRSEELIGATTQIGALFALNTFGAVLGTFLSGFMLLPRLGVTTTNYVGAAVNLTLATIILVVERRITRELAAAPAAAPDDSDEPAPTQTPRAQHGEGERKRQLNRKIAVASYAVSGATAMVYQVLWTRALAIVLGSSVYSFTLILLAFLIGLALGAAVMTRMLPGIRRPVLALGLVHALTLGTAIYSYLTLDQLPEVFLLILRGGSFNVDELLLTQFVLASLTMLPATLAMGGVMPLTMRIYTQSVDGAGKDVGVAYALNTLGAITGSFAAGFVVLPVLGLQRGLLLCAAITAGLSALLLWNAEPLRAADPDAINNEGAPVAPRRPLSARPLALVVVLVTAGFVALSPRWNLAHFSAGLFRISIAKSIFQLKNRLMPNLLYYKDGVATTVSVEQWDKTVALKNNGKVDASNGDDMATQILVGLMPLLFHPTAIDKPPRVAVVGYGSGVTAGAVTQFPIGHADVIELEPAVVEAGDRYFADVSHLPSRDPRVKVIIGDGRNFMTQSDSKYDVIVSEPSNPWITGVSNLFTVDYWKLARSRLAEDGVFCQWAQLYELSQPNIKTLLRSFASVFPYTYVFAAEHLSSDVILVASHKPMPLDLRRLRRNFQIPGLRAELRRASVESAEEILADLLLTPDELWAFTAGAALNTDDNARIEFLAPRDLLGYMRHESSVPRVHSNEWLYGRFERYLVHQGLPFDQTPAWLADEKSDPPGPLDVPRRADFYAELGRAMLAHGKKDAARRMYVHTLATGAGTKSDHLGELLVLFAKRDPGEHEEPLVPGWDGLDESFGKSIGAVQIPAGLSAEQAKKIREEYQIAVRSLVGKKWIVGLRALRDWPMAWIEQMGPDVRLVIGYLLYKADLVDNAVDHLEALLNDASYIEQHPGALYYLARSEFQNGEPRRAIAHMEAYLELRKKDEAAQAEAAQRPAASATAAPGTTPPE